MNKKKIIVLILLGIVSLSFYLVRNTKTGTEKTIIKNKIKKPIREKIVSKNEIIGVLTDLDKIRSKTLNSITNKDIYIKKDVEPIVYNNVVETIKFEEVLDNVPDHFISTLNLMGEVSGLYTDYLELYNDAKFFKADFLPLFERKVGEEVSFVLNNEEYFGFIVRSDIEYYDIKLDKTIDKPLDLDEYENPVGVSYSFRIQPDSETYYQNINISGHKEPSGKFLFNGNIDYPEKEELTFKINNNIGIIVPTQKFLYYLSADKGVTFE